MRALAFLLVLLAVASCSNSVDPTLGTPQAFSLYGYLDPTADRQAIRVVPIIGSIDADTVRVLPVEVISIERGSGSTTAWRDSAIDFRDGSIGHVFVADYTPTPGATVELRVTETTGERRVTAVDVNIPTLHQSVVSTVLGPENKVSYRVSVDDVPNVITGRLRTFVTGLSPVPTDTVALDIPIEGLDIQEVEANQWKVEVPFIDAVKAHLMLLGRVGVVRLVEAEFSPFVASDAWAIPGGGLDLDRIVEPGTFSNVTGGFGFVGAGYETPVRWIPSLATQSRAGFLVDQDPASQIAINEVSLAQGWVELFNQATEPILIGSYEMVVGDEAEVYRIPPGSAVAPRDFVVLRANFDLKVGDRIWLRGLQGQEVQTITINPRSIGGQHLVAYGSYPDGLSLMTRESEPDPRAPPPEPYDVFQGPVQPTPGAPNRLSAPRAVINEIHADGDEGWVEVRSNFTLPQGFLFRVVSSPDDVLSGPGTVANRGEPYSSTGTGALLDLPRNGGEVFLIMQYRDLKFDVRYHRVTDVRSYAPQTPGRSVGYLPDGPDGTWSAGLLPTRGAPNTAARFVSL